MWKCPTTLFQLPSCPQYEVHQLPTMMCYGQKAKKKVAPIFFSHIVK